MKPLSEFVVVQVFVNKNFGSQDVVSFEVDKKYLEILFPCSFGLFYFMILYDYN